MRRKLFRNRGNVANYANTTFGGWGNIYPTKNDLANKLNIDPAQISFFQLTNGNSDIECHIHSEYQLNTIRNNTDLTLIDDREGKITSLNIDGLRECAATYINLPGLTRIDWAWLNGSTNAIEIRLPNVVYQNAPYDPLRTFASLKKILLPKMNSHLVGYMQFMSYMSNCEVFYAPLLPSLNQDPTSGGICFNNFNSKATLYVPPEAATNNNGGLESHYAVAQSRGSKIVFVQNFTKPDSITDLSCVNNSGTVTFTFTPPASANRIDFYEVYAGELYCGRITASGDTKAIPSTHIGKELYLISSDIYYNQSESNKITL